MVRDTPFILTLDQGSHASRAILYDLQGRAVRQHSVALEAEHADPVRSEYRPDAPYETLRECIDHVLPEAGEGRVLAAALACQRSSIACWDKNDGRALSPVISWQDRRTEAELERFSDHAADIRERTGLRLSAHYGATKLDWCLEHLPAVWSAMAQRRLAFGPLASRLIWQLTREHSHLVDPANAARTLLVDHEIRGWSPRLLELFDIPPECLPTCVASEYGFGHIPTPSAGDIPLSLVTGDQSAALYAHGPLCEDTLYATLGTGAFLIQPARTWRATENLLTGIIHDDGSERGRVNAVEGTVNGAGSALTWLREQTAELPDGDEFEAVLPVWLAERNAPPLFLNGVHGLGTPFAGARIESRFVPSARGTHPDVADQAVAVIESIVFLLEENRRAMTACGIIATRIVIGGGLSRLDGLCQRLADLSGLTVRRSREAETTGRGLAFLLIRQLTGREVFHLEDDRLDDFLPTANAALCERFAAWQTAMRETMTHA
ncbi:MAG: hypothetical protein GC138_01650 [Gammaproteobacteria bacterium]|nr:hypothetical protein [Gammaproteobacteria bacterium]